MVFVTYGDGAVRNGGRYRRFAIDGRGRSSRRDYRRVYRMMMAFSGSLSNSYYK